MWYKSLCAAFVLTVCVGLGMAEEFRAVITKVADGKVTFYEMKGFGKDAEKGDSKTLTVADSVKVVKGKFDPDTKKVEAGEAIEGGLKAEQFTSIGEKGVRATIITNSDNKITEIRVGGRGKKN